MEDGIKSWDYSSGEIFTNLESYADLCMLKSIHSWIQGEYEDSIYYIEKAESYWDGTGFKDGSWINCYDTYKLGQFIATCKIVEYESDLKETTKKQFGVYKKEEVEGFGATFLTLVNIGKDANKQSKPQPCAY